MAEQLESLQQEEVSKQLESQQREEISKQQAEEIAEQLRIELSSQLRSQLWNLVENQLESQLGNQLESLLDRQVWHLVVSLLEGNLKNKLETPLESELESLLGLILRETLERRLENTSKRHLESLLWQELATQLESQLDAEQLQSRLERLLGSQLLEEHINSLVSELASELGNLLANQIVSQLDNKLLRRLEKLLEILGSPLLDIVLGIGWKKLLWNQLESRLERELKILLYSEPDRCIYPEFWASYASVYDFCFSVLNCTPIPELWDAFQGLIQHCGLILFNRNICIVCDRPTKLSFDRENRFHAEGEPCLEYADGFAKLYAYQGVILPEKYGKLHPNQWQAQWLLDEDNAELRRVLIQGIGYERICQELQATERDSWQEYTLLIIKNEIDIEPIHLLKMTCPSTGRIHVLRVPPDVYWAREAIYWVNGGIDPEEFAVQT